MNNNLQFQLCSQTILNVESMARDEMTCYIYFHISLLYRWRTWQSWWRGPTSTEAIATGERVLRWHVHPSCSHNSQRGGRVSDKHRHWGRLAALWQSQVSQWPRLAQVARTILAIPATETSSERVFSIAGRTVEERRSNLHVDTVDDLLLIHGLH